MHGSVQTDSTQVPVTGPCIGITRSQLPLGFRPHTQQLTEQPISEIAHGTHYYSYFIEEMAAVIRI